jgi:hypothetical protein
LPGTRAVSTGRRPWLRVVTGIVVAFITVASLLAAVRLVVDILTSNKLFADNPTRLLATGGVVGLGDERDRVRVVVLGPRSRWCRRRAHHPDRNPAFVCPEMLHTDYAGAGWVPRFIDYLSLAFWTATAVSPADISAIKPWAKALMMVAAGSIALAVLVIGSAVNLL